MVAFQIQAPNLQGGAIHHLAHALGKMGADYYVFALTFFVIGGFCSATTGCSASSGGPMRASCRSTWCSWRRSPFLPFPSSVMGRYGGQASAVILYATNMIAVGLLLGLLTLAASTGTSWRPR